MGEISVLVQSGEPPATSPSRNWQIVSIPAGWIWAFLVAWLGGSQLLLWRFLDIAPVWAYALGGMVIAGLCTFTVSGSGTQASRLA